MNSFEQGLTYLLQVAGVTAVQLFTLGGPALLLIYAVSLLSALVQRLAGWVLGPGLYLLLFGWLGTTVHETGHALAAMIVGHRVVSYQPFAPNRAKGTLGEVKTAYNPGSLYQHIGMFFIGIAPVLFGTFTILGALLALFWGQTSELFQGIPITADLSSSSIFDILRSSADFLRFLFSPEHLLDWRLYLFLYIAFAVGSSIHLSRPDIAGATAGCLTFIAILFMFNLVMFSIGAASASSFAWISPYYTFFYVILVFVMLLNLIVAAILWLPATIRKSAHR